MFLIIFSFFPCRFFFFFFSGTEFTVSKVRPGSIEPHGVKRGQGDD